MHINICVLLILFVFAFSCSDPPVEEEKSSPNVLFILADDLGYHDLSVMGSTYYETPHIDRIAKEGMIFTNGYATCQVCSPSRASIMSGKVPARHGITDWIGAKTGEDWRKAGRHNKLLPPSNVHNLPAEYVVLPEAMKEAGYKTFFAGKWHLGSEGSWPTDHGFDINKGGWDVGSPRGGFFAPWQNPNLPPGKDGENLSIRLANETAAFIRAHRDTSFFAYLSFYAVHAPIQTTEEKWARYRAKAEARGIAQSGFKMGHFLPIRQVQDNPVYAGLLETMDDAVGIVLNTLDELGLAENTIVIFTSDNGGVSAGDAFATSNLPLRGGKGYQYEGGIREPYFIKAPMLDIAGKRNDTPATGADFYPTILDLVGAQQKPQEHEDGMSLLPAMNGQTMPERSLVWHYPHYGNQGGRPSGIIRRGDWKLIHYYEDESEVLYNLKSDLEEQVDLAAQHPDKVKEMSNALFDFLKEAGALFPEPDPAYDEAKEKAFLDQIVKVRWPKLEQQRMDFLAQDFDPGNEWWGSKVTMD